MNRNVEAQVALSVGGDLDEADEAAVERRAAVCPHTRACRDEMRSSLAALHACRDRASAEEPADEESLWPAVASRLPSRSAAGSLEFLRPWVPAITVAALLLSLATVATNPPAERTPMPAMDSAWARPVHAGRLTAPRESARPREIDVRGGRDPLDRILRDRENAGTPAEVGFPPLLGPRVYTLPDGRTVLVVPQPDGWE